ncbi:MULTISPECIES: GntR family transcriptional regulator [unclassified Roseitalea]|uniref:GntR family transcriptional regulator n=1 Tax=unclassified Roseitalea TaxID=2639107 RepID=UPI00273E21B9|nr:MULTISPECIES: GntR family transcriptional regulator [unclassified Roseitalea]
MRGRARRGGALPLYLQISELLTREIAAGLWPDGARLPTEADLASQLGVAVGTLRKALSVLETRGLVVRVQGSGTYVRGRIKSGSIYELFHLELRNGAGLPTAQILSLDLMAHPGYAPPFGEGSSQQAWRVRRLRRLGGVPAALEEIWFDARHAPRLQVESIAESMHLFYKEKLGFWITRVEDRITMAPCPDFGPPGTPFIAGAPLGRVTRISWSNANTIEEYSQNWYDPATVDYVARWQ